MAKAWLQRCIDEHPSCHLATPYGLPNRVVDVGVESEPPRIYTTKREKEPYVTLSYCWGRDRNLCSLTTNIDAHSKGIPLEDLPKTIADAVIITRQLGIRYMWIDALCILQDSEEDLIREIAYMGDIYANSFLTIAAKFSENCHDGCFRKRNYPMTAIYPLDIRLPAGTREKDSRIYGRTKNRRTSSMNKLMALLHYPKRPEKEVTPILETRGWTLQEALLSRRMLSFGKNELSWSCRNSESSESKPQEVGSNSFNDWQHAVHRVLVTGFERYGNLNRLDAGKLFNYWLDIVADFSNRKLSKNTDKLPAISGVQAKIAELLKDTPVAGMWKNQFFVPSLLWQVAKDEANESGVAYRCPSWSWVSVTRPVIYRTKPQDGKINEQVWYHDTTRLVEVVSWHIEASNQLDRIEGYVTLRCKIIPDNKLVSQHTSSTHTTDVYRVRKLRNFSSSRRMTTLPPLKSPRISGLCLSRRYSSSQVYGTEDISMI